MTWPARCINLCLCGSKKTYEQCCSVFHQGISLPKTAEELMRSRYSAYALKNLKYLKNTQSGKAAQGFDLKNLKKVFSSHQWLGLAIINAENDPLNPDHAFVEFRAMYEFQGTVSELHERSEFLRINGRWYYIS